MSKMLGERGLGRPRWFRAAAWDRRDTDLVEAVLREAERRIKAMEPAPQSSLTFEGGKRRALRMIRDMKAEVKW